MRETHLWKADLQQSLHLNWDWKNILTLNWHITALGLLWNASLYVKTFCPFSQVFQLIASPLNIWKSDFSFFPTCLICSSCVPSKRVLPSSYCNERLLSYPKSCGENGLIYFQWTLVKLEQLFCSDLLFLEIQLEIFLDSWLRPRT